jgi:hypothetical protein
MTIAPSQDLVLLVAHHKKPDALPGGARPGGRFHFWYLVSLWDLFDASPLVSHRESRNGIGSLLVRVGGRYRILSTQNEGGLAHLPVRHPFGALDGGLKGDSPGDFWVLGSYASKASPYHFKSKFLSLS